MIRRMISVFLAMLLCFLQAGSTEAGLLSRLSTRSGPSAEYEETGTFFRNNWESQRVQVTGKAYTGGIWWVEVDFEGENGIRYRVWTEKERVDTDLATVPEILPVGKCHLEPTEARFGPGENYAKSKLDVLFFEDEIDMIARENGYIQVDYYDVNREIQRRFWVPESAVSQIVWY